MLSSGHGSASGVGAHDGRRRRRHSAHSPGPGTVLVEGRVDLLESILDEGFEAVHISGYVQSKPEWLDQFRSGQMAYHDVKELSTSVDVDGDRAVAIARNAVTATIYGSRATWNLESTHEFTHKRGRWLIVRSRAVTF